MHISNAANVASHDGVSHVAIHIPILWISLMQRLHVRSTPAVACSHVCCNVTPHAARRLKPIWHGFIVTEQTIHLMHKPYTRLSLLFLAVSPTRCKCSDREWHVTRCTAWLKADVTCGEIPCQARLPRGNCVANSTLLRSRDFVTMLFP